MQNESPSTEMMEEGTPQMVATLVAPPQQNVQGLPEDMAFVQKGLSFLLFIGLIGLSIWAISGFSGGGITYGPSAMSIELHDEFDSLIQSDNVTLTGKGVTVCIVDTGINLNHIELEGINLIGWKDFVASIPDPYDDNGHGTMMAGILVAKQYFIGLAPDVDLLVAKALPADGTGSDATVAEAIDWCTNSNADVISLSLGGAPSGVPAFFGGSDSEEAVGNALQQGIVVVAAAGNDGESGDDNDVASPGIVENAICVGAVDTQGNIWEGSSVGDNNGRLLPPMLPRFDPDQKPALVAPGEQVPVILPDGQWGLASGTSASTVYVSGAIALMFEAHPEWKPDGAQGGSESSVETIKEWIQSSVKPKESQNGHDDYYGYGLLQVVALITTAGQN